MRGAALLVLACACDQVFAIRHTHTSDAPFFDGRLDAPFACPMLGTTPAYSPYVHLVSADDCFEYSPSFTAGRVVAARCNDATYPIYEGPLDGPLGPAVRTSSVSTELMFPRLTPDGSRMYLRSDDLTTGTNTWLAFTRSGDGTWQPSGAPGFPTDAIPSNIVRGPSDDRLLLLPSGGTELDEWSNSGGTWHQTGVHQLSELGMVNIAASTLSSDGLRLIVLGSATFGNRVSLYSDRASLGAPFRTADMLAGVPPDEADATISDDCSRVYFSGLGALFYVRQL